MCGFLFLCYNCEMDRTIISFLKKTCQRFGLRAIYVTDVRGQNDVWSIITKQGIPLMNFTTEIFYHMPSRQREKMVEPTLKRGLNQLMGERSVRDKNQLYQLKRMGKIIV